MANYATLIAAIQSVITQNGNNEITGPILQQTLISVVNSLGSGYQFIGIATPSTTPGTPDQKVFYIGSAGTYPNFGPAVVPDGNMGIFYYDSGWHFGTVAFPIGTGTITETNLATALVDKLFATGYKFAGIATPSTNPEAPDQNVFYIGGAGTYPNFSGLVIPYGYIGVLKYNGIWNLETVQTEDAQVSQLQSKVDGIADVIDYSDAGNAGWQTINLSTLTHINKTISSGGEWQTDVTNPNNIDGVIIPIGNAQKIRLENASNGGGVYVFLKSPTLTFVDFSSQNNSRNVLPSGESIEITEIAADSLYLYVNLKNSTVRIENVEFYYPSTEQRSERLDALDESVADIERILEIESAGGGYIDVDFADYPVLKKTITSEFVWTTTQEILKSCIIDLTGVSKVNLINNTSGNSVYAFLTSDNTTTLYPSSQNPTSRNILQSGTSIEIQVASDSKFLFVNYYNQTPRLSQVELYYSSMPKDSQRILAIEKTISDYGIAENPTLTEKDFDANYNIRNIEKVAWTWWFYPQLVIDSRVHNHTWVGYTDEDGFVGLVNFNPSRYTGRKVALKWSDDANVGYAADDHNNPAVLMLPNGRMVCIYASGHEYDNMVYIRVADDAENYKFSSFKAIQFGGKTTYVQVMQYNGSYFVFVRCTNSGNYSWQYIVSTDGMQTWSSPATFLVGTAARYYIKLREVYGYPNLVRVVAYGHPTQSTDNNIRMGFIDLSDGKVYNSDGTTYIGQMNGSLSYTSFNVILATPSGKKQRLLDVAITGKADYEVAYAVFTESVKTDGIYKVATNGIVRDIVAAGVPFWTVSVYLGGVTFITQGKIVVSRNNFVNGSGKYFIEIYVLNNGSWSLEKTIHEEEGGEIPIINVRPICDAGGNMVAWQRGRLTDGQATNEFSFDMKLYDVHQDRVII